MPTPQEYPLKHQNIALGTFFRRRDANPSGVDSGGDGDHDCHNTSTAVAIIIGSDMFVEEHY